VEVVQQLAKLLVGQLAVFLLAKVQFDKRTVQLDGDSRVQVCF
jgi:hypothetical protein